VPQETILETKVPPDKAGFTLLDFLTSRFRYHTRDEWESLIRKGKVRVNGQKPSPLQILHKGNRVSHAVPRDEPEVNLTVEILHRETSFLVVAKPAGLPCHADGIFRAHTLLGVFRSMPDIPSRSLGLPHRLDRETSGLMVVSLLREAQKNLSRQFETGSVSKEYLAIVQGEPAWETIDEKDFIGPARGSSISLRRTVVNPDTPGAQMAHTRFEVLKRLPGACLIKCIPHSGRTHQIRVHLEHLGHPVVGDKLYGRSDDEYLSYVRHVKDHTSLDLTAAFGAKRQLLHASRLSFGHPETGAPLSFESPMPQDMAESAGHPHIF
jgi:RluA family pseudouridine synthase